MKYLIIIYLLWETLQKSDVYFTKEISSSKMVEMLKLLNLELTGNVALKIHSGESGGKYFLTPDFLQEIYDYTKGTYVECNTAYTGSRTSSANHKALLEEHGWTKNDRRFVLMDEDPTKDEELTIENFNKINKNYVGEKLKDFNSCVVLSHFKGHQMDGFGGALKQLSIGFASQKGKTNIHTAGKYEEWSHAMSDHSKADFPASMADAASSIVHYFNGKIGYITVMANISLYCDCAGGSAPAPKIHDIGILASLDPVAIDKAGLDLIKQNVDTGTEAFLNQINNLNGEDTVKFAEELGLGSQDYNLINVDENSSRIFRINLWILFFLVFLL